MCYPGSLPIARPEVPGKLWDGPPLYRVAAVVKSSPAEKLSGGVGNDVTRL